MKKFLLLFLIFSVNFVKPADAGQKSGADAVIKQKISRLELAFLTASELQKKLVINYLVSTERHDKSSADEFFNAIGNEDIKKYLLNIKVDLLEEAKKVYNSLSSGYKIEQGNKLMNPYNAA